MKEILVLSGKGGTGKTTISASLAHLAQDCLMADCDVDAPDLHLLLHPQVVEKHKFVSGVKAEIMPDECTACGICMELCAFDAINNDNATFRINNLSCEGCGVCAFFCPEQAIRLNDNECGEWYISSTQCGTMVHASLYPGEENSGKLVTMVKRKAAELGAEKRVKWIIVDGPPGIGCLVIASMSGSDIILAVTEPTVSGLHDLERIYELSIHFKTPIVVCINKWDINMDKSKEIEDWCIEHHIDIMGKVGFSEKIVESLADGTLVTQHTDKAAEEIKALWGNLQQYIEVGLKPPRQKEENDRNE
jgi:MinD superfamily P-loop ATPase